MLFQVTPKLEWSMVETSDLQAVFKYVERLTHFNIPVLVETNEAWDEPLTPRYKISVPHQYKYDLLQIQIGFGY